MSASTSGKRRGSRASWIMAAAIVAADAYLCVKNPQDFDRLLINAMLAMSAFATLHTRLLSLASAGFAAIGAYSSAILAIKVGLPVALSIPAAVLICGLLAILIGLPVLRLNDVYLAICTLGFGEIVRVSIILLPGLTGGSTGANLSTGFAYEAMKRTSPWVLALALAALCYLFWSTSKSKAGRALRAIRENPDAAATMGIDVVAYKNAAFVSSALIAGLAGAFYAHSVGSLDAGDFKFSRAVDILGYAVLGGSSQWFGPLLGAGLLTALPILLRDGLVFLKNFAQLPNILNGLALMLVIIFMPGGLSSLFGRSSSIRLPRTGSTAAGSAVGSAVGSAAGGPSPGDGSGLAPENHLADKATESPSASQAEARKEAPLLSLVGLSRSFGGVAALDDVGFDVEEGKIYGLIGPNGAGKTTLINAVSGIFRPSAGKIIWEGRPIQGKSAHRVAKAGIARTYQNIQLFGEMSVLENVVVGRHIRIRTNLAATWLRLRSEKREEGKACREAMELLKRLGLEELAGQEAGRLSYGDQRRVEIARALALQPRLLLLDEPAAGMNEKETAALGEFILDLKRHGFTLLVVEHHMDLIMSICDEIVVLNFGKKIAQGSADKVSRDEAVLEAYLGRE
jgi:branched-chain amino acid transport system permease protein